jgi:hypothetical protein
MRIGEFLVADEPALRQVATITGVLAFRRAEQLSYKTYC